MKYFFLRCLVALASVLSVGVSAHGQNLSWTVDILDHYTTNVTGQDTGQPGIASAFFNNEVWVAYLDSTTCVGNECNIQLGNNGGGLVEFYQQVLHNHQQHRDHSQRQPGALGITTALCTSHIRALPIAIM